MTGWKGAELVLEDQQMKITDVKTWVVGNPPPGIGGKYFIFVKLTTDGDVVGYGEAYNATFSAACHGPDDRGHGRALSRRPRSARHRDLLPPRLFVRLHPAPGRFRHGLLLGAGDGLLGHYRQGGQQAGLQAARRPGARDAALLHLSLPAHRQRPFRGRAETARTSTTTPIWRPTARSNMSSRASTP